MLGNATIHNRVTQSGHVIGTTLQLNNLKYITKLSIKYTFLKYHKYLYQVCERERERESERGGRENKIISLQLH